MILTCPACATRYQADEAKFPPDGRQVRCAKCGNVWHQAGPAIAPPVPEPDPAMEAPAPKADDPIARARAMLTAAAAPAPAPKKPRKPLLPLVAVVAGWAGLILVVLLIGISAVRYRQEISVVWPQSAGVYSRL